VYKKAMIMINHVFISFSEAHMFSCSLKDLKIVQYDFWWTGGRKKI